jgi:hypothetical protein
MLGGIRSPRHLVPSRLPCRVTSTRKLAVRCLSPLGQTSTRPIRQLFSLSPCAAAFYLVARAADPMLAAICFALAAPQTPPLQPFTLLSDVQPDADALNMTQMCRGCLGNHCQPGGTSSPTGHLRALKCLGCSRQQCASPFCMPQERQGFCGLQSATGRVVTGRPARVREQRAAARAADAAKNTALEVLGRAAVMAALDGLQSQNVSAMAAVSSARIDALYDARPAAPQARPADRRMAEQRLADLRARAGGVETRAAAE